MDSQRGTSLISNRSTCGAGFVRSVCAGIAACALAHAQTPLLDAELASPVLGQPGGIPGDIDGDGVLDIDDVTVSEHIDKARNTYDLSPIDLGHVLQQLGLSTKYADVGVLEANFLLTSPPLNVTRDAAGNPVQPRIIRRSGGLRLLLVDKGADLASNTVAKSFAHWGSIQRTLRHREGYMTYASADLPADLFPASAEDMSVRKVRSFPANDGALAPWIVTACGIEHGVAGFDANDTGYAVAARANRLFKWNAATARYDDRTTDLGGSSTGHPVNTSGLAVGDVNLDGYVDIVFGNYGDDWAGHHNELLLGCGSGFAPASPDPFTDGGTPIADPTAEVVIDDLDADGWPDIVVGNRFCDANGAFTACAAARDYVLWNLQTVAPPFGTCAGAPSFSAPTYLEGVTPSEWIAPLADTVALDVAAAIGDDLLKDIVAGNHGKSGTTFESDGGQADVVYKQGPGHSFTWKPLDKSDAGLTTDVVFVDVVKSAQSTSAEALCAPAPAPCNWEPFLHFQDRTAVRTSATICGAAPTAAPSDAWQAGSTRDGRVDILRVFRGRNGWGGCFYLNDPFETFNSVYGPDGQLYTLQSLGLNAYGGYAFGFVPLRGKLEWAPSGSPPGTPAAPAGPYSFQPGYPALDDYQGLFNNWDITPFPNVVLARDFVRDNTTGAGSELDGGTNCDNDTSAFPDLLFGCGYELGGVPNRLAPFASSQLIGDIDGGQFTALPPLADHGSASASTAWLEGQRKGYGSGLIDVDDDGDLDGVRSSRAGSFLYVNQGGAQAGVEGQLRRVDDTSLWPFLDVPDGRTRTFTEDSATADFDLDGDHDLLCVGFAGQHDYSAGAYAGMTRGEGNDEDASASKRPWFDYGHQQPLATQAQRARFHIDAILLENHTIHASAPRSGQMAMRSDRLDPNGRYGDARGGDHVVAGDFDGDGRCDAFETLWNQPTPGSGEMTTYAADPTVPPIQTQSLWTKIAPNGLPDYDHIAPSKALAFRLWMNVKGAPNAGPDDWLRDEAATRIGYWDSGAPNLASASAPNWPTGALLHFGTVDRLGGDPLASTTAHPLLHYRTYQAAVAADFNVDGYLDAAVTYYTWAAPPPDANNPGYNLFLNNGQGKLIDFTYGLDAAGARVLPAYESPNVGAPAAATTLARSVALSAFDANNDGDVDLFVGFLGDHAPAMLENNTAGAAGGVVPSFVDRAFTDTATSTNGWLKSPQWNLNLDGSQPNDPVLWLHPIDADRDGDQDLVLLTPLVAHRFYRNHLVHAADPTQQGPWFVDDSAASTTPGPLSLATTRLSAHHGEIPVDTEAADLTGDGWPDLWTDYTNRPPAVYVNTSQPLGSLSLAPTVSIVFPEHGVRAGRSFRVYGRGLTSAQVLRVRLKTDQTSIVIPNSNGNIVFPSGSNGRYMDVKLPAAPADHGPAAIEVVSTTGASSGEYRGRNFAILK